MARIISSIGHPDEIANYGERIVYKALRAALPNHFLVFYSVPFIREHRAGNLVDGENDFIVLDQQRGVLLVLEVKEGIIRAQTEGDQRVWYQNDRKCDSSPWQQVVGNKYSLIGWLSEKLRCEMQHFPLSHGHAVLLPNVHTPIRQPEPGVNDEVAFTWGTERELAERVEKCSEAWRMAGRPEPSEQAIEQVRQFLMPDFVYGDTLRDRIGVERRDVAAHPACSRQLLDFIGNRRRARIAGCAGSGKTTLAVAKARELAGLGKQVLFLVYNTALCDYLRQHLTAVPAVTVQTFHNFCRSCCGDAWPQGPQDDNCFWWERAPELLDQALGATPIQFDAVLVDEAQDFQCAAWLALEKAVKADGWYYLFYDPEQNVFGGDLQFPVAEAPFLLQRNCRGTRAILSALKQHTGIDITPSDELPEGAPVREECADTAAQRRRLLGKILHDWIRREGLSENQVVILGAHSMIHTSIGTDGHAGSFKIVERGQAAAGVVPYYTYMAFKGCEADAVILLDVDPTDDRWGAQGLYTAITRARHLLGIIGSDSPTCRR